MVVRSLVALGHRGRWLERNALAVDQLTAERIGRVLHLSAAVAALSRGPRLRRSRVGSSLATESSAEWLGRQFVEAFNRRDSEGLVAVSHAQIEFYPTGAGGTGRSYHGHEGLRAWVEELGSGQPRHHARILDVEVIDPGRVVVSCEVIMDGAAITPSTMIGVIADGLLIEVRGYLTDTATVRQIHAFPR